MAYGTHPLHHNGSLRRAISTQAGGSAFPYAEYSPVNYDARYDAYGAYHGRLSDWWSARSARRSGTSAAADVADTASDAADAAETATNASGFWTGSAGPIAEVVGGLLAQGITNRSGRKVQEGISASNERIAIAQANAQAQSGGAQESYDEDAGMGMGAKIGISLAVAGVLGVGAYFIFKNKG